MSTSSLAIVKELRRLAEIPAHREYLLRNDVNSILIFVDPDEHHVQVVTEAIKALECLAEEASESNHARKAMKSTIGLMELMKKIEMRDGYAIECKASAMKIQRLLNTDRTSLNTSPDGVMTRTGKPAGKRNKESVRFLGGNKKAKIITLQIKGLDDQERRQQCLNELVRIKGVISLTFNMNLKRCTVRARAELSAQSLGRAINNTKVMEASQVLKDDDGKEILLPVETANSSEDDDKLANLPDYLDEDPFESPSKDDHAVARPPSGTSGSGFGNSWFGSIVSAVNKNLYW